MANYKPWKALERRHAKRMKGIRIWRQDYSELKPDGESQHYREVWDCKALSRQSIVRLFLACEEKYRRYTGSRRFHLCLFDPTRPRSGDFVVCRAERYAELCEKEELLDSFVSGFREFVPES